MPQYNFNGAVWKEEEGNGEGSFFDFLPHTERMASWIEEAEEMSVNILHADTSVLEKEAVWGSLIYRQSQKKKEDVEVLHFYITDGILVTNKIDFDTDKDMDRDRILQHMERAASSIELLMILLGDMVGSLLHQIDAFEDELRNLLWKIKEENNQQTWDEIELVRHEILLWKNLILGFSEIKMILPETFGKEIMDGKEYYRTSTRIGRMVMLIESYQDEVKNMVDIENVVANYRGNEIVKTLTILTALFTPVMAFGALWGMNFEYMPELKWKSGYAVSLALILVSTVIMYIYFKKKGWTGEVLRSLRKNSGAKEQKRR